MNKMKIYILLTLTLLISSMVSAQDVEITNSSVKKSGNNIIVTFDAKIGKVSTNEIFTIIPVLWNSKNEQALAPLVVAGRNKRLSLARLQRVKSDMVFADYNAVEGKDKSTTSYECVFPFQDWMNDIALRIDKNIQKCCSKEMLAPQSISSNNMKPIYTPFTPLYDVDAEKAFIEEFKYQNEKYSFLASTGGGKNAQTSARLSAKDNENLAINFEQGKATVDMSTVENRESMKRLKEAVILISMDENVELDGLIVYGVASPEGSVTFNEQLSRKRAEVFVNYLEDIVPRRNIKIKNIGENWNGLRSLVAESNMDYKDEVLAIIDTKHSNLDIKESKLKELRGGAPYSHLANNFYPLIRQGSYVQVLYTVKSGGQVEKIKRMITLIQNEKFTEAIDLLDEFQSTPYLDNLRGVCYLNIGDRDMARELFKSSAEGGNKNAMENIKLLNIQSENVKYL